MCFRVYQDRLLSFVPPDIQRFPQDSRVDAYPFLHLVVGDKQVWPHISVIRNEIEEFALIALKRKQNGIYIDRLGSFRLVVAVQPLTIRRMPQLIIVSSARTHPSPGIHA